MSGLIFATANTVAFCCWIALIFLPRWPVLLAGIRFGVIGALAVVYSALAMTFIFRVEGGGFGSIDQVRALFASDPVLVAGWIHFLAFDLFVGLWIVGRAAEIGLSRLLQLPILAATFMFGPLGLLMMYGCLAARLRGPKEQAT